jgi:chromosome segregation protein
MRISRLEIFGFKSFMDRIVIPLEGGLTGVVGPNGCGKSNIVDALRWVLGETRASSLRGEKLEDVIFNGTDKLRPLGLAEVTLTLRAQGDDFFAELGQQLQSYDVLATLTEEDLGESSTPPTGLDGASPAVEEVLSDVRPTGAPALRVLEGGIGGEQESVPTGLDEATLSQHEQPEESSDENVPLSNAPAAGSFVAGSSISGAFLSRFAWLKSVSEVQITRRLYRSGESEFFINRVPCRLRDLKEFFRAVGIGARSHTIVAQGEVSRIVTAKPEERRMLLEEAAGVVGLKEKVNAAKRRLEETANNLTRLADVIAEVARQVNSLRRQATQARNREALKFRIREIDTQIFRDKLRELLNRGSECGRAHEESRQQEVEASAIVARSAAEEEIARGGLLEIDLQGDSLRNKVDSIREELSNRSRMRSERAVRLSEIRAFLVARTNEIRQLEERRTVLLERARESAGELEQLTAEEQLLAEELIGLEQKGDEDLRNAAAQLDGLRELMRKKDGEIRVVREQIVSVQSTLEEVQKQLVAMSPVTQLRKTFGENGATIFGSESEQVQLLVDGIQVPPQYVRALQAVMAERAAYVLSADPHAVGASFLDRLLTADGRNSRGFGLGVFRAGTAELPTESRHGLSLFSTFLTISPAAQIAASACLRNLYFAEDLLTATTFFSAARDAGDSDIGHYTVVTRDGELLTNDSFFSLRHEGGVVQLKNKVDELSVALATHREEFGQREREREVLAEQIALAQQDHARALSETQERNSRIRNSSNQLATIRGRLQAGIRLTQQTDGDVATIADQIRTAQARIEEHQGEQEQIRAEIESMLEQNDQPLKDELAILQEQYAALDAARREGRERLSQLALQVNEARRTAELLRAQISAFEVERQKTELGLQNIRERLAQDYGLEVLQEVEAHGIEAEGLAESVRMELSEELQRLRTRIVREGDVDPSSIQRFEEEAARLDELESQHRDLDSAAKTLQQTIERLTETSQRRFQATFDAVKAQFEKLVPRLFGGGRGTIDLVDPTRPLETGIDILLRPPGKKPKSIDLLSGGEKALTATALIIAMFLERPSPLCVLDEVDAPLDEANLIRFLQLLKEMSSRTQFMMITHNKQSMTMSDRLIGVTQQEPGASQVISVSLQEAYSQVA